MIDPTVATSEGADNAGSPPPEPIPATVAGRPGPWSLLILSAWCGLVAGLLEVATLVARKSTFDVNHLYGMTHHFVWLIPLIDLALFVGLGSILAVVAGIRPRRGSWLAARLLCALTPLPAVMIALPKIYGPAWLLVTLGIADRLVPVLERNARGFRKLVRRSFPIVAGIVPVLAAWYWGADRLREWSEQARPMPAPGAPNVVLVVLDTVAADHLGLYGYGRPTSPTLDELARAGIRFDAARSASSWTLPSHATMFTGRWPHELSAGWANPLDGTDQTLAEYLGARGYATAGFVANNLYCATDSGLARGFGTYRDFIFPRLTAMKPAALVDRTAEGLHAIEQYLEARWDIDVFRPAVEWLWLAINLNRKDAATVNREFFDWLSRRNQPDRPFFAFLNICDAHWPYQLPELSVHRFGHPPRDAAESELIQDWFRLDKRGLTAEQVALARDAYDDCVAHVDEQVGRLVDELGRRGLRERTWVIVLADHGESFGEHAGVFCHGTSLYQTELHVPLLILPPTKTKGGGPSGLRVANAVSLRDLAATVVDLAGQGAGSPFGGESLARFWDGTRTVEAAPADPASVARAPSLSEVVPYDPLDPSPDRLVREPRWPLAALSDGDWTYIRREGEVREELFHLRDDANEAHNLTADPAAKPRLERMRQALGGLTGGPLTPGRFKP